MKELQQLQILVENYNKDNNYLIEELIHKLTFNWEKLSNNDLMLLNYLIINYQDLKNNFVAKVR